MGDFTNDKVQKQILNVSNNIDLIISDISPSTCGIAKIDHLRIIGILEEILSFAKNTLNTNGSFIAKVFQGGTEKEILIILKQIFEKIYHFKPKSSRKESKEIYVVGIGFKK